MEIGPREKTKGVRLVVSGIEDRLFVKDGAGNEIWVSTVFGRIQVGVVGGQKYGLVEGVLVPESGVKPIGFQSGERAEAADDD